MNRAEIENKIIEKYKSTAAYKDFTVFRVTQIAEDTAGGHLAVVRSKNDNGGVIDEVCFVYPDGLPYTFSTTEELVRFLERQSKSSFLERIFTRPVLTGLVFMVLILLVAASDMLDLKHDQIVLLGSTLGLAGGFYFSSKA